MKYLEKLGIGWMILIIALLLAKFTYQEDTTTQELFYALLVIAFILFCIGLMWGKQP